MKREQLEALGLDKAAVDTIMNLHGADITALRGQLDTARNDLTAANQKLEGYDPEWREKLSAWKRDAAIDAALAAAGARNAKAARAMLKLDGVTLSEDGKLSGLDEQLTALTASDGWLFQSPAGASASAAQTGGTETQTQPAASGMRTGGEHGVGGSAETDGVETAFYRLNPGLKA